VICCFAFWRQTRNEKDSRIWNFEVDPFCPLPADLDSKTSKTMSDAGRPRRAKDVQYAESPDTPTPEKEKGRRRKPVVAGNKAKKAAKMDSDQQEDEEEELKEVYASKNFVAPEPRPLETIFEAAGNVGKRGVTEELAVGKHKSKRFLQTPGYWVEDKAKTRHRAKMTTKAYKGRKRFRLTGLTVEQEEKLSSLIADSEDQNESPVIRSRRTTPQATPRTPLVQLSTPRSLDSSPSSRRKGRRRSSLFKATVTTEANKMETPRRMPHKTAEKENSKPPTQPSPESREVSPVAFPDASPSVSSVSAYRSMVPDEELLRKIEEADSAFGKSQPACGLLNLLIRHRRLRRGLFFDRSQRLWHIFRSSPTARLRSCSHEGSPQLPPARPGGLLVPVRRRLGFSRDRRHAVHAKKGLAGPPQAD